MYAMRMCLRLSRRRLNLIGVNGLDAGEAKKIVLIQGEDMIQAVVSEFAAIASKNCSMSILGFAGGRGRGAARAASSTRA
jgi:hypothetical protein